MEFPRQEYWNELPFPSPGDLSNSGIELESFSLQADSLPSEPPGKPWFSLKGYNNNIFELLTELKPQQMEDISIPWVPRWS